MSQFPNPSTQFQKGQSGNPGGKSAEQRQAEIKAAEDSAIARAKLAARLRKAIEGSDETALDYLTSETLRLWKDSEDRAHGQPEQHVKGTVTQITREVVNKDGA